MGKSQLAIAYSRKYRELYSALLWLKGKSRDTLLQSFAAFGWHVNLNALPEATAFTFQHPDHLQAEAQVTLR